MPAGLFCMVAGIASVCWLFGALVDPKLFTAWLIYMGAILFALLVAHVFVRARLPTTDFYLDFWGPLGRTLNLGLVIGTIASVWMLMPVAGDLGRLFLIVVYMWFVVVQVMVHGEGVRFLTTAAIVGVFGSLVLFMLANPMPYALAVAGVLILMAATMAVLQKIFRGAVRDAIDARTLSETLTEARDQALATVIVERDAKTRFLESASHDLRQPLQAARMFLDQAERNPPGPQRDKAVDRLHWALDATDRSLTQILDHLRLDAGEVRAEARNIAIGPLLAHLTDANTSQDMHSGTSMTAMPSRLRVSADPVLLERAIANYIGNALRHAAASRILLGARRSGAVVRIWVIDDGVGTVPADRETLFDDYVQGSDHGDALRGGFGLGLSSVRRLAVLMSGNAGLDARWTRGSAFWLELPAASD